MRLIAGLAALAVLALAGSAYADPAGVTVKDGAFLAPDGKPLYTFANDMAGMSHCTGGCATAWPPLMAADSAKADGDWSLVAREDGKKQWAYKGMPVYTFAKDTAGAAATGVSAKWPLAKK